MLLYLIRHGQTDFNEQNKVQGTIDTHLSPTGLTQAQKLGKHLRLVPFTEAWSSPLLRARETVEEILKYQPKAKLHIDDRLGARHFGSAQGKVWDEVCGGLDDHMVEDDEALKHRLHAWLGSLINTHTPSASASATPALMSPTSPLSSAGSSGLNPFDLVKALPRPGMSRTPSVPAGGGLGSGVVLVMTHSECLSALISLLTAGSGSTGSGGDGPNSPIEMHVPEGMDVGSDIGNTGVAILRVWWEETKEGDMEARGRVEAWGDEERLKVVNEDE